MEFLQHGHHWGAPSSPNPDILSEAAYTSLAVESVTYWPLPTITFSGWKQGCRGTKVAAICFKAGPDLWFYSGHVLTVLSVACSLSQIPAKSTFMLSAFPCWVLLTLLPFSRQHACSNKHRDPNPCFRLDLQKPDLCPPPNMSPNFLITFIFYFFCAKANAWSPELESSFWSL